MTSVSAACTLLQVLPFLSSGFRCSASDFELTSTPSLENCIFISPGAFLRSHSATSSSLELSIMLYNGMVGNNNKAELLILTPEQKYNMFTGYWIFLHEPGTAPGSTFIAVSAKESAGVNLWSETECFLSSAK